VFYIPHHTHDMMGTHERNPIAFSLTRILLLSLIYCKYYTPSTWQWQNFTRHLLLCMLFSRTSGIT